MAPGTTAICSEIRAVEVKGQYVTAEVTVNTRGSYNYCGVYSSVSLCTLNFTDILEIQLCSTLRVWLK